MHVIIPDNIKSMMWFLLQNGAKNVLLVGGFARDLIFRYNSADIDLEVYGLTLEDIQDILRSRNYSVDLVGKSFGILKVNNTFDISIPRRDNKTGAGHTGFDILSDPGMSFEEAALRRDFTINSFGVDVNGDVQDPYGGIVDFKECRLKHVSSAFAEDPLRVLRGMQFAARFDMYVSEETAALCAKMSHGELPKERIWEEWKKWALKGNVPSKGIQFLVDTSWICNYPEINNLRGVKQDYEYHPEGDVYVHTLQVVDFAAKIADRQKLSDNDRLILLFSALCHDFGKPSTTEFLLGRWRAFGHCEAGAALVDSFLERIGAPKALTEAVKEMVVNHLAHTNGEPTTRAVLRLSSKLKHANIELLSFLVEADASGRYPLPPRSPLSKWVDIAKECSVSKKGPKPILMGKHLIDLGIPPGPNMGKILKLAFEAQLQDVFRDLEGALSWFKSNNLNED